MCLCGITKWKVVWGNPVRVLLSVSLLLLASLVFTPPAQAWWFFCSYGDAAENAKAADYARQRYNYYLSQPPSVANDRRIAGWKAAWDALRNKTFGNIKDFIQEVPGTTFTGQPDIKDVPKQLFKDMLKEALKQAGLISYNVMPTPGPYALTDFAVGSPILTASPLAQAIPLIAPTDDAAITAEYKLLTPEALLALDDGSNGPPPADVLDWPDTLFLQGTFTGFVVSSYTVYDALGNASTMTPALLSSALANDPSLGQLVLPGGGFDAAVASAFPGIDLRYQMVSWMEITDIDPVTGNISGRYFTGINNMNLNGNVSAPEPGAFLLLTGPSLIMVIRLRLRKTAA